MSASGPGSDAGGPSAERVVANVAAERPSPARPGSFVGLVGSTLNVATADALVATILQARSELSVARAAGGPAVASPLANITNWMVYPDDKSGTIGIDFLKAANVDKPRIFALFPQPEAISRFILENGQMFEYRVAQKSAVPCLWATFDQFIFDLTTAGNVETIETALAIAKELHYKKINLDRIIDVSPCVQMNGSGSSELSSNVWTRREAWYIFARVKGIVVNGSFASSIANDVRAGGESRSNAIMAAIQQLRDSARGEELNFTMVIEGTAALSAAGLSSGRI